jgi:hypothetical protein
VQGVLDELESRQPDGVETEVIRRRRIVDGHCGHAQIAERREPGSKMGRMASGRRVAEALECVKNYI